MSNTIEVKNVSKKYKEFEIDSINLNVQKGTVMGFVGQNGAGKSTTIKLILDVIERDSGEISVFGMDNIRDGKKIKDRIGVVFDDLCMSDMLNSTHIDRIMDGMYSEWSTKQFNDYIKRFKLPEKKTIKTYSRGMRMKMSLAIALSHNAELLILDEPTSGLDPIVRDEILDIFLEYMQNEEHSMLISSHITSDLEKIADYITFIHEGKIIFSENKDELMENHGLIRCGNDEIEKIDKSHIVGTRKNKFGSDVLVSNRHACEQKYRNFVMDKVSIEEIMVFYARGNKS